MRGRKTDLELYDHLYHIFKIARSPEGFIQCFYCGMPADTIDHVPPISKVAQYRQFNLANELYVKVTACRSCNTSLGDSLQINILERADVRRRQLEKEYAKFLKMPNWSEEEISNLGKNLRSEIVTSLREKENCKDRVYFREGIASLLRDQKFSKYFIEEDF